MALSKVGTKGFTRVTSHTGTDDTEQETAKDIKGSDLKIGSEKESNKGGTGTAQGGEDSTTLGDLKLTKKQREELETEILAHGYTRIGSIYAKQQDVSALRSNIENSGASLLIGETGTGKTSIVNEIAKEQGIELVRVSVNGSTGVEEIIGKWLVREGTTFWNDGLLIDAMKNGKWIVFDEINSALPEILFTLHSLLDDDRKVTLVEKNGEVVRPHKDFRFFATMNPPEEYAGTKELNKALLSRFDVVLYVDLVPLLIEAHAIKEQVGLSLRDSLSLVALANKLREYKHDDVIFYFCSTRDLIQCGKLWRSGDTTKHAAVTYTIGNKMTREEYAEMKSTLESHAKPTEDEKPQTEDTLSVADILKKAEQSEKNNEELRDMYREKENEIRELERVLKEHADKVASI